MKNKNDGAERGDKGAGGCVGGGLSRRTKTEGHTSDFFHPFLVSCLHSKCFPSPLLLAHSLFLSLLKRCEVVRLNLYYTSLTAQMQQISSAELTQSMLIQESSNRYFIPEARFAVFLKILLPSALRAAGSCDHGGAAAGSLKVQTAHTSRWRPDATEPVFRGCGAASAAVAPKPHRSSYVCVCVPCTHVHAHTRSILWIPLRENSSACFALR